MKELLEKILAETSGATKVAFIGIGEEKLTDDGVGPYIISKLLQYNKNEKVLFVNAGVDPMGRMEEIIAFKPSHLILIDTCTLNGPPGTVAILKRDNISQYVPISSHTIPVHIVVDLIVGKLPDLKAFMIGIVPESLEGFTELYLFKRGEFSLEELNENEDLPFFDIRLSPSIQSVAEQIIEIIKTLIEKL